MLLWNPIRVDLRKASISGAFSGSKIISGSIVPM
jgi:hypothetical protein